MASVPCSPPSYFGSDPLWLCHEGNQEMAVRTGSQWTPIYLTIGWVEYPAWTVLLQRSAKHGGYVLKMLLFYLCDTSDSGWYMETERVKIATNMCACAGRKRGEQEGNGPIDLRRQGPWKIIERCCRAQTEPCDLIYLCNPASLASSVKSFKNIISRRKTIMIHCFPWLCRR